MLPISAFSSVVRSLGIIIVLRQLELIEHHLIQTCLGRIDAVKTFWRDQPRQRFACEQ